MNTALWTIGLVIAGLGSAIALSNWWLFFAGLSGKHTPSLTPLLGGALLAIGTRIVPTSVTHSFFWIGLIVDLGCAPYFALGIATLLKQLWHYRPWRGVLELKATTPDIRSSILVYPDGEALYQFRRVSRVEPGCAISGSLIMKADLSHDRGRLDLSLQKISVSLEKTQDGWKVVREAGWGSPKEALLHASITQRRPRDRQK